MIHSFLNLSSRVTPPYAFAYAVHSGWDALACDQNNLNTQKNVKGEERRARSLVMSESVCKESMHSRAVENAGLFLAGAPPPSSPGPSCPCGGPDTWWGPLAVESGGIQSKPSHLSAMGAQTVPSRSLSFFIWEMG